MNEIEKDLIGQLRHFRLKTEYAPFLLRPEQLAGFSIHGPAASVTELFGFGEIGSDPPKFAFRLVSVGDVDRGSDMKGRAVLASWNGREKRVDPDRRAVLSPIARHDLVVDPLAGAKFGETAARRFAFLLGNEIDWRELLQLLRGIAD